MFNYDGDINASPEDHRDLMAKVIQETFPSARCTVRVRHTKAMARPLVSISIDDGPTCKDLVDAIPLLSQLSYGTRWAYCGKVLLSLGYSVRPKPRGALAKISQEIWDQLRRDTPHSFFVSSSGRLNPQFSAKHSRQVAARMKQAHPVQGSFTMGLISRGPVGEIVQLAMEQRRDDLDRATPPRRSLLSPRGLKRPLVQDVCNRHRRKK